MTRQTLFRGKFGEIGGGTTMFPSEDGTEDIQIPSFLLSGYDAALAGTRCRGCQHTGHFMNVPHLKLPDGVLGALRIAAPETTPIATIEGEQKSVVSSLPSTSRRRRPVAAGDAAAD